MTVKFYRVGGCNRDEILGVKSKDIDYAVEAASFDAMKQAILDKGGEIFLEKPEYLVIRAKVNGEAADFVLCRKDGVYTDGRRPDTVEAGTIYDDLARRDFTMNAIAFDTEKLCYIDPFEGARDIKYKVIKCVGNAEQRFTEDSLRLLRAIRFAITKDFVIGWDIDQCLTDAWFVNKLKNVSQERISDELTKCFKHDTLATLKLLSKYDYLTKAIFAGKVWLCPTLKDK